MRKLINKLQKEEKGSADVIVTVMMLPIMLFLVFVLINMSNYFQDRSALQDYVRQATRLYAIDPTIASGQQRIKDLSTAVSATSYNRSGGTLSITCGKVTGYAADGTPTLSVWDQTIQIGDPVACEIIGYKYIPVTVDPFGFSNLTSKPINIFSQSASEIKVN